LPGYLAPYVLTGAIAVVISVLAGMRRTLQLAVLPQNDKDRTWRSVAGLLVGWFLAALVTSLLEFYKGGISRVPTTQYGLFLPIFAGVALYWRWPALRRLVELVPQEWIVAIQVYRVLGGIFLVLYAGGLIPGAFALPAGTGDVIVGVLAPAVAILYSRRGSSGFVRAWNLFGIADLIVAVTTAFLTSPSRLQLLAFDKPNTLISSFPLVLIPVFLVPLAILLHLASLSKLSRADTTRECGFRTARINVLEPGISAEHK
jgi:hypothetical protein